MPVPAERIADATEAIVAAVVDRERLVRVESRVDAERHHVDAVERRLEERIDAGFARLTEHMDRLTVVVEKTAASVAALREAGAGDAVKWTLGARLAVAALGIVTAVVTTLLIVAVKG